MWIAFVRELERRWQAALVSIALCGLLGALLNGLVQRGTTSGRLAWSVVGMLCAAGVGLAWSLGAVLRRGRKERVSALERAAAVGRLKHALRLGGMGLSLAALLAAGLVAARSLSARTMTPENPSPPPAPPRRRIAVEPPSRPASPATPVAPGTPAQPAENQHPRG